jgi:CRISPR-associated protein Cas1
MQISGKLHTSNTLSILEFEHDSISWKNIPVSAKRYPVVPKRLSARVSTSALSSMGFWGVDCLFLTQKGRPVAMLKSLDDDSHVKTQVCQYEALKNGKGTHIAKQFVLGKIEGQNKVLKKYGLRRHDYSVVEKVSSLKGEEMKRIRARLMAIEGHCSERYFKQIFSLIPETLRPERRKTFKAYDGVNNIFNLAYEVLSWKVHHALLNAKLEPYLGFLHSEQFGKPSLVCDFQELYRYLTDDFAIQYCQTLDRQDFAFRNERLSVRKKGKREYLVDAKTKDFTSRLGECFETYVEIPQMKVGVRQTIETLISEEALLLAKYLRSEKSEWVPRTVDFGTCSD